MQGTLQSIKQDRWAWTSSGLTEDRERLALEKGTGEFSCVWQLCVWQVTEELGGQPQPRPGQALDNTD